VKLEQRLFSNLAVALSHSEVFYLNVKKRPSAKLIETVTSEEFCPICSVGDRMRRTGLFLSKTAFADGTLFPMFLGTKMQREWKP
jgi:hypothetical protein